MRKNLKLSCELKVLYSVSTIDILKPLRTKSWLPPLGALHYEGLPMLKHTVHAPMHAPEDHIGSQLRQGYHENARVTPQNYNIS